MEYQKIANLIDDDASNQPSKFKLHTKLIITKIPFGTIL